MTHCQHAVNKDALQTIGFQMGSKKYVVSPLVVKTYLNQLC